MKPCVRKVTLMDVPWSDCPANISDIVKRLWSIYELGNHHYFLRFENFMELHALIGDDNDFADMKQYCEESGIQSDDEVLIHWSW